MKAYAVALATALFMLPSLEAHAACKSKLVGKNFQCSFKSDSRYTRRGKACFQFRRTESSVVPASKFDLLDFGDSTIEGLALYTCSCDPAGAFQSPRFNRAERTFTCSGLEFIIDDDGEFIDFPWGMQGKLSANGKTLTGLQVDILGYSYKLRCNKVSSCGQSTVAASKGHQLDRAARAQLYLEAKQAR